METMPVQTDDLWRQVRRRSWHKTLHSLDLGGDRIVISFFLGCIYLLLVWTQIGATEGGHEMALRIALSAAPLLLFPLVYLYNFFRGPSTIYEEARKKIDSLEMELDGRDERQAAINNLWRLRAVGVAHRNAVLESEAEYPGWKHEYLKWRNELLSVAGKANINLRGYLEILDRTHPAPANQRILNADHDLDLRVMSEVLLRLGEYLRKEL